MIPSRRLGFFVASGAVLAAASTFAAAKPVCDKDNGGLTLPAGFCAQVVADDLGFARHAVAAANGDLYVALQNKGTTFPGGVVALRDTDGDGKFDVKQNFATGSSTGIYIRNGYLYVAKLESVERWKLTPGKLVPDGPPEVMVDGLPTERQHHDKGLAFDGKGHFYINVGSPSNACQKIDRTEGSMGMDPCPILEKHGGIWRFDENKVGQKQEDGERFGTGFRQEPAITWGHDALYVAMNSRDSMDTLWPGKFTAEENATRPAEPLYRIATGKENFGWPYCFFDYGQQKYILNPEYGGDGKTTGRCTEFVAPAASYPAHWAPVDINFYNGKQFPARYRGGAFIAFHGSWNRSPLPQSPSAVVFQPFAGGKPSGKYEVFADGFAGKEKIMNSAEALARADGVAEAPDGSLYITESQKGKVWRVFYTGKK